MKTKRKGMPVLYGKDQTRWVLCLQAAATIAAGYKASPTDPTEVDPISLADNFYRALQARLPEPGAGLVVRGSSFPPGGNQR